MHVDFDQSVMIRETFADALIGKTACGDCEITNSASANERPYCFVKRHAFSLSSAHNTTISKRASRLGDNGALGFAVIIVMEVDDDPIPYASQFMGARGIGMKRCEVPTVACRVEDRKPGFRLRIKSLGRDAR